MTIPNGPTVTVAALRQALGLPAERPDGTRDLLAIPCAGQRRRGRHQRRAVGPRRTARGMAGRPGDRAAVPGHAARPGQPVPGRRDLGRPTPPGGARTPALTRPAVRSRCWPPPTSRPLSWPGDRSTPHWCSGGSTPKSSTPSCDEGTDDHERVRSDSQRPLATVAARPVRRDRGPGRLLRRARRRSRRRDRRPVGGDDSQAGNPPGEDFMDRVGRLNAIKKQAEEIILADRVLLRPETGAEDDE